jgi:hypothetical protein
LGFTSGVGLGFARRCERVRRRGRWRGLRGGGPAGFVAGTIENCAALRVDRADNARGFGGGDRAHARGLVGCRGHEPLAFDRNLGHRALVLAPRVVTDPLRVDLGRAHQPLCLQCCFGHNGAGLRHRRARVGVGDCADRSAHGLGVGSPLRHHASPFGVGLGAHPCRVGIGGDSGFLADLGRGGRCGRPLELRLELGALQQGGGVPAEALRRFARLFRHSRGLTPTCDLALLAHGVSPGVVRTG